MSNKNRQRGKSLERFIAKDLGGRRVGILGQEDVILHRGISCECKERVKLPMFIHRCMAQAEGNAKGETAIVILHELGKEHEQDFVLCRYKDFKAILEKEDP
jgi:hypothetical protein